MQRAYDSLLKGYKMHDEYYFKYRLMFILFRLFCTYMSYICICMYVCMYVCVTGQHGRTVLLLNVLPCINIFEKKYIATDISIDLRHLMATQLNVAEFTREVNHSLAKPPLQYLIGSMVS